MKILAIDTSANPASVALSDNGVILGEYMTNYKKTHSERIMPMCDEVLKTLGFKPSDIDVFAVCTGPGSFTGLRIGISTVKAFAQVNDKPIAPVSATMMLAGNIAPCDNVICPIIDARNNKVYSGLYEYADGTLCEVGEVRSIDMDELLAELSGLDKKIIFLGDAVSVHKDKILEKIPDALFAPQNLMYQRASAMIPVAEKMACEDKLESAYDVVPMYLNKSQAEREREERLKEENK